MKAVWKFVTAAVLAVAPVATVAGPASAGESPTTTQTRTTPYPAQAEYIRTLPALDEFSVGEYVLVLQARLIRYGYELDGTAYFGSKTKAAVANWQAKHGITASGHVGVETWTSLLGCDFAVPVGAETPNLAPGGSFATSGALKTQAAVNDLQWIFPSWAHISPEFAERTRTWAPAQYDDVTARTVQDLQWRLGLFPSGLIGPDTTSALDVIDSVAFSLGNQNLCG